MKIILVGGGTGGHVFPLITVAKKIREKYGNDAQFLHIGTHSKLEEKAMQEEGIPMKFIYAGKFRRYFSLKNFVDCFKFPLGFVQSLWILLWNMPDAVFSKGGYVSLPVVIAAK